MALLHLAVARQIMLCANYVTPSSSDSLNSGGPACLRTGGRPVSVTLAILPAYPFLGLRVSPTVLLLGISIKYYGSTVLLLLEKNAAGEGQDQRTKQGGSNNVANVKNLQGNL
eukprot:6177942-Pleurochrysis_carterae.AAC.2